ncbi:MAG TPA: hypothetical protein VFE32_15195 [Puia sp.]|jgi:hypothetical protein|nr:hypothetical protein [Puia sp.]
MLDIKILPVILATSFSFIALHAQQSSPLIKGNVTISITRGTIACDLVLSDLPDIRNYVIRLNSGMNIHYFKDLNWSGPALYYDMDTKDSIGSDATKAYYLHENRGNPARYIPKVLEVNYLGMYPVIADSAAGYMGQDWRGNIAFNGCSIRAEGIQGNWYPELYDMDKRQLYDEVRYDINVTCADCSVLFINGSTPALASHAEFKSDFPREMSIYCGTFKTSADRGIWLLNPDMQKADEQQLYNTATAYQGFYEKMFDIPYNGSLTFVQTTPVADPSRWAFSFYSAPTTFNVGIGPYGMQSLFDKDRAPRAKQIMAHELAHYYFGTLLKPKGVFGPVIMEGFAEYLSFELTRSLEGESAYQGLLDQKIKSLNNFHNYQPLSLVRTESDYGDREYYLYYYAPALFLAIQKEIGGQAMRNWLRTMVDSKADVPDYQFLVTTFKTAVADKALAAKIEAKYFTSPDALKAAIDELGKN